MNIEVAGAGRREPKDIETMKTLHIAEGLSPDEAAADISRQMKEAAAENERTGGEWPLRLKVEGVENEIIEIHRRQ